MRRTDLIYCVEDNDSVRELVVYTLNSTGFEGKGFSNAKDFWSEMKNALPELIILDIMLPEEDGISVLKKLRSSPATESIPVMLATAKGEEFDKVTGLDAGADDYLVKPFGMMEMVSRIKAVLRRSAPKTGRSVITMGGITVDRSRHTVTADGREISLTLKEYDLLIMLIDNRGTVFTRDSLLSDVWQSDAGIETRTVDVHIGTLRTKLGKCGDMIRTVRGVGYKMEENDA